MKYRKTIVGFKEVDTAVRERHRRLRRVMETAKPTSGEQANVANKVRAEVNGPHEVDKSTLRADITTEGILAWWKESEHPLPLLTRDARVVLGASSSSAVL